MDAELTERSEQVRPLHGYRPTQLEKARCGFVGMRNLGATCYMNSLLQHLFNVHEFRRGILQAPLEQTDKGGSLMYQLQSLFGYLQESEKQFAETWEMCQVSSAIYLRAWYALSGPDVACGAVRCTRTMTGSRSTLQCRWTPVSQALP